MAKSKDTKPNTNKPNNDSRRKVLKAAAAAGAVGSAALLPNSWVKPVLRTVAPPAHAKTTEVATTTTKRPRHGACYIRKNGKIYCKEVSYKECKKIGGKWGGYGSKCKVQTTTKKPPPRRGACLIFDNDRSQCVLNLTEGECESRGGLWQGPGSTTCNIN